MLWLFLAVMLQCALLAWFGRTPAWRSSGYSALAASCVIALLWTLTDGGTRRTEAWLILSSLPLVAVGIYSWRQTLGRVAFALGVALTLAMLAAWYWAAQLNTDTVAPTIVYSVLVLVAMVALFLIVGALAMRWLVESSRN